MLLSGPQVTVYFDGNPIRVTREYLPTDSLTVKERKRGYVTELIHVQQEEADRRINTK